MEQIPLIDLIAQYNEIKTEMDTAIHRVLDSGHFILGDEVSSFESNVSDYLKVSHCIGVASGTDALILSLRALEVGPGDEVIIPAYTFFATIGAVIHSGAKPVLVDIDPDTYCIDVEQTTAAVTNRTRAVIPVHLYGQPADMEPLQILAKEKGITLIEDNAQAIGAEYKGKKAGSLGEIACLSFFPSKNLGGYGDGGMITTHSPDLAEQMKKLRAHGWKKKYFPEILGYNSRLDAIQAAILNTKLKHLDRWNDRRRDIAAIYNAGLADLPDLKTPSEAEGSKHVYHLYILQTPRRNDLKNALSQAGIATGVYYPQPIHMAEPSKQYGYQEGDFPISEKASLETLAIPVYPELSEDQIDYIIQVIRDFHRG